MFRSPALTCCSCRCRCLLPAIPSSVFDPAIPRIILSLSAIRLNAGCAQTTDSHERDQRFLWGSRLRHARKSKTKGYHASLTADSSTPVDRRRRHSGTTFCKGRFFSVTASDNSIRLSLSFISHVASASSCPEFHSLLFSPHQLEYAEHFLKTFN